MPIDHQYKDGVTTLLQFLPESELIELAKTVSGQRITVSNDTGLLIYMFHHCCLFLIYFFSDAINAILDFSASLSELLRRKRMKVEYLFAYLVAHGQCELTFKSTKTDLMNKVLTVWKKSTPKVSHSKSEEIEEIDVSEPSSSTHVRKVVVVDEDEDQNSNNGASGNQSSSDPTVRKLGISFLEWFYSLLKPIAGMPRTSEQSFSPKHFFADASYSLFCVDESGRYNYEEHQKGAPVIFHRIRNMISDLSLVLNPNLSLSDEAIRCFKSPYGLVFIGINGTFFSKIPGQKDVTLAGLFEQSFGIAQDPNNDNNWVVKFTQLRMKISSHFLGVFSAYFSSLDQGSAIEQPQSSSTEIVPMEM